LFKHPHSDTIYRAHPSSSPIWVPKRG